MPSKNAGKYRETLMRGVAEPARTEVPMPQTPEAIAIMGQP
jgi:hypothetical protein